MPAVNTIPSKPPSELVSAPTSRQLVWADGPPASGDDGRLQWQELSQPDLFLGLADGKVLGNDHPSQSFGIFRGSHGTGVSHADIAFH